MSVLEKTVNIYNGLHTNVLDDDIETNEILKEVFMLNGMPNVAFFTDSDLFLAALNENVHLCIVDENIKGSRLQGLPVIEIIRSRYPETQIIFFSGTDDPKILKQILKFRPEGYVDKDDPDFMHILVTEVQKCLMNIKHNMEFVVGAQKYIRSRV